MSAADDHPTARPPEPFELERWFATPDRSAWSARIEQELGGRPPQSLVTRTADGLEIQPLYTRLDLPDGLPQLPGELPRIRGNVLPTAEPTSPDIAVVAAPDSDPQALRLELEHGGATTVLIEAGDANHHALPALLRGLDLERSAVGLSAGRAALPAAASLLAEAMRQGAPLRALRGWLGIDPLGTLAACGSLPFALDTALRHLAEAIAWAEQGVGAGLRVATIDSTVYHEAGAGDGQELGFAIATAVDLLRDLEARGLDPDAVARRTAFVLRLGCDFFTGIAKLRAARWAWSRVCETCGLGEEAQRMFVIARTSQRVLTRRDRWVNMLRTTASTFAALTGGADVVVPTAFDALSDAQSELGRRIARNTPIILTAESGLHQVLDPAGGSYFLESLTERLAEEAWSTLQDLERDGGMARALLEGRVAPRIAPIHERRSRLVATRKLAITGVSEFPWLDEPSAAAAAPASATPAPQRTEHSDDTSRALAAVTTLAAQPGPQPGPRSDLFKALTLAARDGVSLDALTRALREGELTAQPHAAEATAPALAAHRLAAPFEALRDASDALLFDEKHGGARPRVTVLGLGTRDTFQARATWIENLFAVAGLEVEFHDTEPAASGAPVARIGCVCGSDAAYETLAVPAARTLREAGCRRVVLAARPGANEAALREAGVTDFAYLGCDVVALLSSLWTELEHHP